MRTAVRHLPHATHLHPTRPDTAHPDTAHSDTAHPDTADPALDDALDRIAQLTARLHAVTDLHVPRRTLLGSRVCRACRRAAPCPTAQATRA